MRKNARRFIPEKCAWIAHRFLKRSKLIAKRSRWALEHYDAERDGKCEIVFTAYIRDRRT
ncbi:hypothetical protein MKW92_016216, partial [Papaver armeniacum]